MNDYLLNAEISILERKFNLEESVGFDPNDFPYHENWGIKSEYDLLMSKASEYPTLKGIIEVKGTQGSYEVTILFHEGRYVTFLKELGGTKFSINFSDSYLYSLEFVRVEVLLISLNRYGEN